MLRNLIYIYIPFGNTPLFTQFYIRIAQARLSNIEKLSSVLTEEVMAMDMKVRTEEGHIETHKQVLNEFKDKNETLESQVRNERESFDLKRSEALKKISMWNHDMMACVRGV